MCYFSVSPQYLRSCSQKQGLEKHMLVSVVLVPCKELTSALLPCTSNLHLQDNSSFIVLDFLSSSPSGKHSLCTSHHISPDFILIPNVSTNIAAPRSPHCAVTRCAEMSDAKQYKKALCHILVDVKCNGEGRNCFNFS